jgi:hypothetical protein
MLLLLLLLVALGCVWLLWRATILLCWVLGAVALCATNALCGWDSGAARFGSIDRDVRVDRVGQPVGSESGVDEVTHAPFTAHYCARPRRRAVWVRRLASVLGTVPGGTVGAFVRGRWTPDLPSVNNSAGLNRVLSDRPGGVRILGGGSVLGKRESSDIRVAYFVVEDEFGTVSTVFPELLSSLRSYAWLRARESTLVLALRSRALEWCKKQGLPDTATSVAVEAAVGWAWQLSDREREAREQLSEEPLLPWWS